MLRVNQKNLNPGIFMSKRFFILPLALSAILLTSFIGASIRTKVNIEILNQLFETLSAEEWKKINTSMPSNLSREALEIFYQATLFDLQKYFEFNPARAMIFFQITIDSLKTTLSKNPKDKKNLETILQNFEEFINQKKES